jgi:hypothetical protein
MFGFQRPLGATAPTDWAHEPLRRPGTRANGVAHQIVYTHDVVPPQGIQARSLRVPRLNGVEQRGVGTGGCGGVHRVVRGDAALAARLAIRLEGSSTAGWGSTNGSASACRGRH